MNRNGAGWIVAAVAVLSLAPASFLFGVTLMPSRLAAVERGTQVPWFLTWGLISMTALIAVTLGVSLIRIGMSQRRS